MLEAAGVNFVQGPLACVTKGRVAQVMAQGYGLSQILVKAQGPCHRAGKAADLKSVGQAGAVMVPLRLEENLSLVLKAAEGLAVGNAVNVTLKAGAYAALLLRLQSAPAVTG